MKRRYFIKTIGAAGLYLSGNQAFSESSPRIRFIIASDGHYGQPDTNYEQYHKEFIEWMKLEQKNQLDFVIFNGDLIHDDPVFMPQLKKVWDQLPVPYYVCRGNHDRVEPEEWEKLWGTPVNYSFIFKKFGFILADTANAQGKYLCSDYDWIKSQLNDFKKLKGVFVIQHVSQRKWTKHGVDCDEALINTYKNSNVIASFHGHDHQEDDVKYFDGKPYFWDGHLGGSWGVDYRGYRIVEVYGRKVITMQYNPENTSIVNKNNISLT
ncbi:MAG: metallophosphoesterase [Cyclobacteriaceae bacterium]|nr:metallophosphoesterase [Cyclobacteriaceae bacterium]